MEALRPAPGAGSKTEWLLTFTVALALLIPSASLVWRFSDVPSFGDLHDDSVYYASAKSLAGGGPYRIESLPGEPAQTKYPPLYPLLLSTAWRIDPSFPGNLPIAAWLSWLAIPAIVLQLAWLFPKWGFSRRQTWVLLALFALNPYVLLFGAQLLSETLFLALVLGAMLLVDRGVARESLPLILGAGIVGGLAYLTRSAGIALLFGAIVYLWITGRERAKQILYFITGMLPFIAGWMLWSRMHQTTTNDPALLYYLDYFRYQLYAVSFSDLHLVLWKNADGLLWGMGSLIVPRVADSILIKDLSLALAVAMIAGVVRLVRAGHGRLFALFAFFSCGLLLVWHYPPNERFVLPLFPLALAGLVTEADHFIGLLRGALRHKQRDQRVVAKLMMACAGCFAVAILGLQAYVGIVYLPQNLVEKRAAKRERQASYEWVRANTPADATILSADDPSMYLYTGRHAMRRTLPASLWYRSDHTAMVDWFSHVEPFAQQHGLAYFDFAGVDIAQGLDDDDRDAVAKAVKDSAGLAPLFHQGPVTFFGVRPAASDVRRSASRPHTTDLPPTR
ncbi:MAG: hypothetical protein ABI824_14345 [Acidobacteriota bacterium]